MKNERLVFGSTSSIRFVTTTLRKWKWNRIRAGGPSLAILVFLMWAPAANNQVPNFPPFNRCQNWNEKFFIILYYFLLSFIIFYSFLLLFFISFLLVFLMWAPAANNQVPNFPPFNWCQNWNEKFFSWFRNLQVSPSPPVLCYQQVGNKSLTVSSVSARVDLNEVQLMHTFGKVNGRIKLS